MKKLLFGIGAVSATVAPIATVLSCTVSNGNTSDYKRRLETYINVTTQDGKRSEKLSEIIAVHAGISVVSAAAGRPIGYVFAEDRYGDIIKANCEMISGDVLGQTWWWGIKWYNIQMIKPAKEVKNEDYDWDIDDQNLISSAKALSLSPDQIWFDDQGQWDNTMIKYK